MTIQISFTDLSLLEPLYICILAKSSFLVLSYFLFFFYLFSLETRSNNVAMGALELRDPSVSVS